RLLPELEDGDWAALVITGKPFVFAAGADITQFPGATRELAVQGSRAGHELFGRIRALPYPTLAAINGACLGGGVELALHCEARTISIAVRHFACPECFLGILPAWGGTQLVPRLVGAEAAVKFVVENPMRQNRMLTGPQACELGFAGRPRGAGLALRLRPGRAPGQEPARQTGRGPAAHRQGRDRRRRPDGRPARGARAPAARGPGRPARPQ